MNRMTPLARDRAHTGTDTGPGTGAPTQARRCGRPSKALRRGVSWARIARRIACRFACRFARRFGRGAAQRARTGLAAPAALALAGCAAWAPPADLSRGALPASAAQALAAAAVPADALAAVALPLGHAGPAWGVRAEVPMQPGSTMKLVTSVVALDRLGPGHRGHTALKSAARLADGVLQGDLWLEGGADPDLGLAAFWALLVELRAAGVRRIEGDLVVDRRRFNPARADLGAPPFDDGTEWPYNVIPDALGLADALLPVEIDAGADAVTARTVPPLAGIEVRSRMTLAERRCIDWEDDWKPPRQVQAEGALTVELHGSFPRDCRRRVALQVVDRQRLTEAIFRTLWAELGGAFSGRVIEAAPEAALYAAPADTGGADRTGRAGRTEGALAAPPATAAPMRTLAQRLSRPWGEVLRGMNKASDNPRTRLLYLSLGVPLMAAHPGVPTAALSERVVRQWFAEHRIDTPGLVLDNGSGLSRSERITPLALAQMLQVAWAGRYASDFMASLPLAGEDGTMRSRLKDSPAAGWSRLKTGTLRNVAALAGYVRDAEGRPWAVAMMVNHERARAARPALDALVDAMARSPRPGEWTERSAAAAHERGPLAQALP